MAEPKFDIYQTNAINARKNSVVSAGAGSGKPQFLLSAFLLLFLTQRKRLVSIRYLP